MAKRAYDPERDRFWRDVLERFRASGLSVRDFCRQEKLPETSFYAWRRTIAGRDGRPLPTGQRHASGKRHPPSRPKRPAFLPLLMPQPPLASAALGMALELRSGHTLRLPESMPVGRLAELVRALETSQGAAL